MHTPPSPSQRIEAVDIARGIALLAMASFHFSWDLEFFGYLDAGTTAHGFLKLYARSIASSFLFLAGVSLVLAHGEGVRWQGFWRRFALVAGAAGLITLGTFFAFPDEFIFFGILHAIALFSLLGLSFLQVPWPISLLVAAAVVAAPHFLRSPIFDHPALWWVGLSTVSPRSNDFVPFFPWFGTLLAGIAAGRAAQRLGLTGRLAALRLPRRLAPLSFLGRHSLLFYLAHQPVLIGALFLFTLAVPPAIQTPEVRFRERCEASCRPVGDEDFCARYCACMLDKLDAQGLMSAVDGGRVDEQTKARVEDAAGLCTAEAEDPFPSEP